MTNEEIEQFVTETILNLDVDVDSAEHGVGIHAYVGELLNVGDPVERKYIQFYTTSNIPMSPADDEIGYQPSDILYEQGVIMADVAEVTHPPHYVGYTLSVDEFVDTWISDPHVGEAVYRMIDETKHLSTPSPEWLAQITELYHDRVVGAPWIKNTKRIC